MQEPRPKLSPYEIGPQPRDKAEKEVQFLRETWLKEKKEGDPEIEFKIAFGMHSGPHDLDFLREDFKECDVFMPESVGSGSNAEKALNDLAQGLYTADKFIGILKKSNPNWKEAVGMEHWFEIVRMLDRSKKIVALVDVPEGHFLAEERKIFAILEATLSSIPDLKEKIGVMREKLPLLAKMTSARNTLILGEIPRKMRRLIDNDYRLKGKQKIKVLLSIGILHTPLFMFFKNLELGDKIERSFEKSSKKNTPNTFIFDHCDRLIRELQFQGTLDKISDEKIARAILSRDFNIHLKKSIQWTIESQPTKNIIGASTDYISMFTLDDIQKLYEQVAGGKKFRNMFLEFMKSKGIEDKRL